MARSYQIGMVVLSSNSAGRQRNSQGTSFCISVMVRECESQSKIDGNAWLDNCFPQVGNLECVTTLIPNFQSSIIGGTKCGDLRTRNYSRNLGLDVTRNSDECYTKRLAAN